MMTGVVNSVLEATILLPVVGSAGQQEVVTAVIDTGFNGYLTLPLAVVSVLALGTPSPWSVSLADASQVSLSSYRAQVLWDGQWLPIRVLCVEGDPLIGTSLLKRYKLEADFVDGGPVILHPLF